MAASPASRPELTPASFYDACRDVLLQHPWNRDDARYWTGRTLITPAVSGLSEDVEGRARVNDYYMFEAVDMNPAISPKELAAVEDKLLRLGRLPLAVDLFQPKPEGGIQQSPVSYFTFRPSAVHPRSEAPVGTILHGDSVDYPGLAIPQGQQDIPVVAEIRSDYTDGRLIGFTSRLIEHPNQDPQLLLVYGALCGREISEPTTE